MGTNVYGAYKDVMGKLNARPFFNYTVAVNNDTTYSLNIYAGNEVKNKTKEYVPSMQGLGNFAISGTGQTTKSALNNYPAVAASGSAYVSIITLFTWTWTKGTSAATKTIIATDGYTGSKASFSFTVPVKTHYTVSYNANGGSGAPGSQTKWYGTNLTLSSTKPSRTGYTFQKWNTKSDGSGTSYNPGAIYSANSGTTLYAIWKINTWTVSYNANGGANPPGNQTKTYGQNLTLSSGGSISKTGYTLDHWNTKPDNKGTSYAKGATYTANAALTLYAIWTPNTYTVSYNSNAPSGRTASGSTANSSHTYDTAKNLTMNGYSVVDYVFTGWATSPTGAVAYTNGQSVKNLATSGTKTLYAVWRYAYTKAIVDPPNARRYNGPDPDDTGTSARVTAYVTPAQVENSSFQKSYIETRVYAQTRRNGETTWPSIAPDTTGYQVVDGNTGKINLEFTLDPPLNDSEFETDVQYDVRIVAIAWVSNLNKAEQTKTTFISKANFILDVNPDGRGLGIFTAVSDTADGLYIGKETHLELDTISGTDPLYAAITTLNWQNDVME